MSYPYCHQGAVQLCVQYVRCDVQMPTIFSCEDASLYNASWLQLLPQRCLTIMKRTLTVHGARIEPEAHFSARQKWT